MKTIQISDELYEKLEKISLEMNNQDHRATRMPYAFQIVQEEIENTAEGYHEWYHYRSNELDNWFYVWWDDEENFLKNALVFIDKHYSDEEPAEFTPYKNIFPNYPDLKRNDYYEVLDFLNKRNVEAIPVKKSFEYFWNFLTHESAKRHFEENKHHYSWEFQDYLTHLWRDPDMEAVQQFLCELTWWKLHI